MSSSEHAINPGLLQGCFLSVEDPIIVQVRSLIQVGEHRLTLCVDPATGEQQPSHEAQKEPLLQEAGRCRMTSRADNRKPQENIA